MSLFFARDPLEDRVGNMEYELYPESALESASSGLNLVLGSSIEHIQAMQLERALAPEPELDECVAHLKAQKDKLDSLSSAYFELVSAGPKNRERPWLIPPGWCRGAYELIKKSREWEAEMVSKSTCSRLIPEVDPLGLWNQCRTEHLFLYTWWSKSHKRYEELFCFAMLHHINNSFAKEGIRKIRNSLANIEQRVLRHLERKPQTREYWWIGGLFEIQTSIRIQMSLFNANRDGVSNPLHYLREPPNNLDTCAFNDDTRLNVLGCITYQDLSILIAKVEALKDKANFGI